MTGKRPTTSGRRRGYRTVAQVRDLAMSLPDVTEQPKWGSPAWCVGGTMFAWPRPLRPTDLRQWADHSAEPLPTGDIVAVRVEDMAEKMAVLAAGHRGVFTIHHFRSFPSVLIELGVASASTVRELVIDAWLAVAPPHLAAVHAESLLKD